MAGVSVENLFTRVFELLARERNAYVKPFPEPVKTVIADDSDDHRTRTGLMEYKRVLFLPCGNTTWALALGKHCGGYPGQEYTRDLSAVPTAVARTDQRIIEAMKRLKMSVFFRSSLMTALADGRVVFHRYSRDVLRARNAFGRRMDQLLPEDRRRDLLVGMDKNNARLWRRAHAVRVFRGAILQTLAGINTTWFDELSPEILELEGIPTLCRAEDG